MKFREKISAFMYGRNGIDSLCVTLLLSSLALSLINAFLHSIIIWILETVLIIWCIFRALSRNIYKRQKENAAYEKLGKRFRSFFELQRNRIRDRKTHIYRTCPHCKSNLRLPKRKGKHKVRCPRCNYRFDVKC